MINNNENGRRYHRLDDDVTRLTSQQARLQSWLVLVLIEGLKSSMARGNDLVITKTQRCKSINNTFTFFLVIKKLLKLGAREKKLLTRARFFFILLSSTRTADRRHFLKPDYVIDVLMCLLW